jgi:hypothetical protein
MTHIMYGVTLLFRTVAERKFFLFSHIATNLGSEKVVGWAGAGLHLGIAALQSSAQPLSYLASH